MRHVFRARIVCYSASALLSLHLGFGCKSRIEKEKPAEIEQTVSAVRSVHSSGSANTRSSPSPSPDGLRPRVSDDGHVLVDGANRPMFYLADTAWALFYSMTSSEQSEYFALRARQGFTAVHSILVLGDLNRTDLEGRTSLVLQQPGARGTERWRPFTPNEAFFDEVDRTIERASAAGLILGLLPVWGAAHVGGEPRLVDEDAARSFGCFLGHRFSGRPVIWILGGDHLVTEGNRDDTHVWRALARDLRSCGGDQLMTFHPITARSSSLWFHEDEWLAFNMIQSGHTRDRPPPTGVDLIRSDYARRPVKPTIDAESGYEGIANRLIPDSNDLFTDADIRRAAWQSVLSGAFGFVYGANGLMQGVRDRSERWAARHRAPTWQEALAFPGAGQLIVLAKLFDELGPFAPAPAELVESVDSKAPPLVAGSSRSRDALVIYVRSAGAFVVHSRVCSAPSSFWIDPRTGRRRPADFVEAASGLRFAPPADHDWALVLQCG